ncbi:MAG: hypothetical protein NT099_05330 [Candidatus Saganbacteria bacterium]|nr:hypothetical protein [Candidatus Saganbacteria bacterium]
MLKKTVVLILVVFCVACASAAFAVPPKNDNPPTVVKVIKSDDLVAKKPIKHAKAVKAPQQITVENDEIIFEKNVVKEVVIANKGQIKRALLDMDVDDLNQIRDHETNVMLNSARATGYVKGSNMGGAGGFFYFLPSTAVNANKPSQVDDLTSMMGGAGGFLVNMNPNWALGGLFGGASGASSKKVGADFWSYSVGTMFGMLHSQYKPIINDDWIVGIDLGVGLALGGYSINKTNESMVGQDTVRNGTTWAGLVGLDFRKRINPVWHTGLKAGYFACKFNTLGRGDYTDPGKTLDLSGPYLALCMGGNF